MVVCSETKPTLLAGYIITIVAFVIHLIGFAAPYWFYFENTVVYVTISVTTKNYFGLWQICDSTSSGTTSISKCGRYVVEVNVNVSISKLAHTTLFWKKYWGVSKYVCWSVSIFLINCTFTIKGNLDQ